MTKSTRTSKVHSLIISCLFQLHIYRTDMRVVWSFSSLTLQECKYPYFPKRQSIPLKCPFVLSGVQVERRVSRKYSLGSSMDLVRPQSWHYTASQTHDRTKQDAHYLGLYHFLQVKPRKDLFRQSVLPRLQRADKKHRLSASCSQLRPLNEDNSISDTERCQDSKRR